MEQKYLQNKWNSIIPDNIIKGYHTIRIDSSCIPDLFIGVNRLNNRCLIMILPLGHGIDFRHSQKEKITLEQYHAPDIIVLTLLDKSYYELFNDLILSIYNQVSDIVEFEKYSKMFISTFHMWSSFFEEVDLERLSQENIKGIFGELHVLKSLLNEANSMSVNEVLSSWRGPYDQSHDFVFDNVNIEVKTKNFTACQINISSEYQLQEEIGKGLELLVLSVEADVINGKSIKDLLLDVKSDIYEKGGDFLIVLNALLQKGLTQSNIHMYDNFRFRPVDEIKYDCCRKGFPRLTESNTNVSISEIRYKLNLKSLEKFVKSKNIIR